MCVVHALELYVQNKIFKKPDSFLDIYAWRKSIKKEFLRKEIEDVGIRLFNLKKIIYDS